LLRTAYLLYLLPVCLLSVACTSKTPPRAEKVTVAVPANLYGKDALDNMVPGGADG
jgi:hypothetical protein